MTDALVTIGLITYNAADTVVAALESAIGQSWRPIELIVVDDGSTDATVEIIKTFAASHPEVQLFVGRENGGASVARNRIIAEARGEFIAFFDDDDASHVDRVERQVQRLRDYEHRFADGATVLCHTARWQHFGNGNTRLEPTMGEVEGFAAPSGLAVARRVLMGDPLANAYGSCATCSQLARTDTYRRVGGFDPFFRRGQDTDLCIRLARSGCHFVGIADPLVTQTMTRTSDKSIERARYYSVALLAKNRDLFQSEEHYQFCRRWVDLRHDWLAAQYRKFAAGLGLLLVTHPLRTSQRLRMAMPNLALNRAFGRFLRGG